VAKKEDSNGLWCLKIVLVVALALTVLALFGPVAAALVFFAMAVLDKLDKIAKQRSDNDE
jgi:hypothetical protein